MGETETLYWQTKFIKPSRLSQKSDTPFPPLPLPPPFPPGVSMGHRRSERVSTVSGANLNYLDSPGFVVPRHYVRPDAQRRVEVPNDDQKVKPETGVVQCPLSIQIESNAVDIDLVLWDSKFVLDLVDLSGDGCLGKPCGFLPGATHILTVRVTDLSKPGLSSSRAGRVERAGGSSQYWCGRRQQDNAEVTKSVDSGSNLLMTSGNVGL
ncbi:hypothetical protein RRG08_055075 [Elysia crispata]|uniref:Uncharacterized protein n=1 Tax=Elysia crispata TaxID=231223 RepID=A0AAE1AZJ3_9GAST|nr:hypothetical protein RRG08_055075 [Elysia crispata]